MAQPTDPEEVQPADPEHNFDEAQFTALSDDVPVTDSVDALLETNGDIHQRRLESRLERLALELRRTKFQKTQQSAEIERLHQQNEMRPKFFKLAAGLTWFIIASNTLIMGYYAWHAKENISSSVLSYWIASTVVEILGIIYIIAQYLFPGAKRKRSKNKSVPADASEQDAETTG